jgi:KDO2-lipid IV(A) lauroyltransferase
MNAARDLREGGTWTVGQRLKNDALYVATMGTLRVTRTLPPTVLRAFGRAVGLGVWLCAPRLRRLALENVALALPEVEAADRPRFVRRVYESLGTLLGEVVATLDPNRTVEPLPFLGASRDCLEGAFAEGRGVVFASAHLGPWEQVAASLVAAGVPLTVVAREPYDPRLGRVYRHLREARGVATVYRGTAGAAIALVRALRRGRVLGIPMDLASRVPSIDVSFLGRGAPTPIGPARLAIRTGAPVVVGTAARAPDGSLGISVVRMREATCERALTEQNNAELGERIRAMPEMWPWMHARWPRPDHGPAKGRSA